MQGAGGGVIILDGFYYGYCILNQQRPREVKSLAQVTQLVNTEARSRLQARLIQSPVPKCVCTRVHTHN